MPKRNVILLVATCLISLMALAARERNGHARRFGEVVATIERNYFQPIAGEQLFDAAIAGAVAQLDENSAYLRDGGRDELESALDQRFGGVGLELALDPASRQPVVVSPVIDSPAWRAGIAAGDGIEAIDGQPTQGLSLRDTIQKLRGRVGERVVLTILPPPLIATLDHAVAASAAVPRDVELVREVVEVESVQGDRRNPDGSWNWLLEGEQELAYVRIESFGERTAAEFAAAVESIGATGLIRGLVLDLRRNPGGLLQAAVDVCDTLLEEGVIVTTRGRPEPGAAADAGIVDERRASEGQALGHVPVVVLVDGLSASAAEIVAACLQDAGRATVAGSRTYGKGTVQSLVPLSDGRSLLKLTTSQYLRPSRENIHRRPGAGDDETWGVQPDAGYEVTPTAEAVERLGEWRRCRNAVPRRTADQAAAANSSLRLPRDIDAVLARAIEAFTSR